MKDEIVAFIWYHYDMHACNPLLDVWEVLVASWKKNNVKYDRRRSRPWVHLFRMLRPLHYASRLRIATLSPIAMVFDWSNIMVFFPCSATMLLC